MNNYSLFSTNVGIKQKPVTPPKNEPKFGCAQFAYLVREPYAGEDQFIKQCLVDGRGALQKHSKENPDGWGIAAYKNPGTVSIWKSIKKAKSDPQFKTAVKLAAQMQPWSALGHLRMGTHVQVSNNHPFPMGKAILMHNGLLPDEVQAKMKVHLAASPQSPDIPAIQGTTDTELFARYFQGELLEKFHTTNPSQIATEPLAKFFSQEVSKLISASKNIPDNGPIKQGFNFTLVDDRRIIASRNGRSLYWGVRLDKKDQHPQDVIVATHPVKMRKGSPIQWTEIPTNQVVTIERTVDANSKPDIQIAFQKMPDQP